MLLPHASPLLLFILLFVSLLKGIVTEVYSDSVRCMMKQHCSRAASCIPIVAVRIVACIVVCIAIQEGWAMFASLHDWEALFR